MKRKQRPPNSPPSSQTQEVIDLDEIENLETSQGGSTPVSGKRSWVWNHFKDEEGTQKSICQVLTKSGGICGKPLKKDKTGSTKTFHAHLYNYHRLSDPNLTKKTKMNHMDIKAWSKSGTLKPKVSSHLFL
jgi:hypothetical protein